MAAAFPSAPAVHCDRCKSASGDTIRCSVQDNKNLCQGCFQGLPHARREDIGDQEWVCDQHFNRKVEIFCRTCQIGLCQECAEGSHTGHEVLCVRKLAEEIRCYLLEQLQDVDVKAEELAQLQQQIEGAFGKIEAPFQRMDVIFYKVKKRRYIQLEKETQRISREVDMHIRNLENERQVKLNQVIENYRSAMDKIEKFQSLVGEAIQKDAEPVVTKIRKVESKLVDGQEACEGARLEINSMLMSPPEEIVKRGRQLGSLVRASTALQYDIDVNSCCKDVESMFTEQEEDELDEGIHSKSEPKPFQWTLFKSFIIFIIIFLYACKARGPFKDRFIVLLSSDSKADFLSAVLFGFSFDYTLKYYTFIAWFYNIGVLDCLFSFHWKDVLKKIIQFMVKYEVLTAIFLIVLSSPLYYFQVKTVSENTASIMSVVHSCCFLYQLRVSKTFNYSVQYGMKKNV